MIKVGDKVRLTRDWYNKSYNQSNFEFYKNGVVSMITESESTPYRASVNEYWIKFPDGNTVKVYEGEFEVINE